MKATWLIYLPYCLPGGGVLGKNFGGGEGL